MYETLTTNDTIMLYPVNLKRESVLSDMYISVHKGCGKLYYDFPEKTNLNRFAGYKLSYLTVEWSYNDIGCKYPIFNFLRNIRL